jgi:uncharacterized protein
MKQLLTIDDARALYDAGGGGHDFDHVLRVLALAERIACAEGGNLDVVRTAALLHDVAEAEDREAHHVIGAQRARSLLAGEPPEFVEAIAHCIEAHRFRHDPQPQTLEAKVLSDADKLDSIGAVGVGRVFAYAGAVGTALWRQTVAEIAGQAGDARRGPKELGEGYTPSHEFVLKLDRIPERLYTDMARAIAAERRQFMREFFARLDREATGEA